MLHCTHDNIVAPVNKDTTEALDLWIFALSAGCAPELVILRV